MIQKTDFFNDKYDMEITDPKIACAVFNNYLREREQPAEQKEKKTKKSNDYKWLYDMLPKEKKYAVNNLIKNLISKDKLQRNFGAIFSKILEDRKITTYLLAKYLYSKSSCDDYHGIENEYSVRTIDDLRSILENFKKIKNPQDKSTALIMDICDILSIDFDLLTIGIGVCYDIDEEKVFKLLEEKKLDIEEFLNDVLNEFLKCAKCRKDGVCEWQKDYIDFMQSNKISLFELIAKKLGVHSDEIIIKEEQIFEFEEFPFDRYYSELKVQEQRAVRKLICDLHISMSE